MMHAGERIATGALRSEILFRREEISVGLIKAEEQQPDSYIITL